MPFTVRRATPADEPFLAQATLGNARDSEGIELDPNVVRRGVAALLADPAKGLVFVAEGAQQPVGSCYVTLEWSDWHAMWYWWIQSVYVPTQHRRQGVYKALHDGVLAAARAAGDVRSVRLYVEQANHPALAAYRGLGMAQTHYLVFEQPIAGDAPGQDLTRLGRTHPTSS